VPSDKIKITVSNGWVTLEGKVEWQYQKNADESAVRYLTGVVGMSNLITSQAARVPDRDQVQDRGRVQAQRRTGRLPHH
jgi:osmotically-inducible protein OsmY